MQYAPTNYTSHIPPLTSIKQIPIYLTKQKGENTNNEQQKWKDHIDRGLRDTYNRNTKDKQNVRKRKSIPNIKLYKTLRRNGED